MEVFEEDTAVLGVQEVVLHPVCIPNKFLGAEVHFVYLYYYNLNSKVSYIGLGYSNLHTHLITNPANEFTYLTIGKYK